MAVAFVQVVKTEDHSGIGTAITSASFSVGAGALLICGIATYDPAGNPTVSSVQLDGATSFTQDITRQALSTDSRVYIYSLANVSAGSHTVTVTRANVQHRLVFYIIEVSGAATASYQDGAGASATATAANPASGDFTASVADGFWVALFGNENASNDTTIAAGSGWTMDSTNGRHTDAAGVISGIEYRANPGSAGPFNGNFTAASATYAAAQFVYKALAAAAGAPPRRQVMALTGVQ